MALDICVASIGLVGVLLGGAITFGSNWFLFNQQNKKQNKLDEVRKKLLRTMLDDSTFNQGRSLKVLSKVTGAETEDCRRLLIEINARGFTMHDGSEGWIYIKTMPLSSDE